MSNDIALVKLEKPIEFNKWAQKVCLPREDDTFNDVICSVTGWGRNSSCKFTEFIETKQFN